MSVIGRINKIAEVLAERGLDDAASDIRNVKEATLMGIPYDIPTRRTPRMFGPQEHSFHEPSNPNTPMYEKGDLVVELSPTTGREELMMWDGKKLVPKREIEKMIDQGIMREERIFSQYDKATPDVKKQIRPLLEFAKSKRVFDIPAGEVGLPYHLRGKLACISESLEKQGYTLLVKKLKEAVEGYKIPLSE